MIVYDSERKRIRLGHAIGRGGEATVCRVEGQPVVVAKIYEPSPRSGYDQKLAWMLANPPANPTSALDHASIAWPKDLLYDRRDNFVGYLMPYIQNAVPLLDVFNPRRRAQTLPDFNWKYLHRTARNLAAALDALHARDYVVGDLNESNVRATPEALVTLIDTDSFQVLKQSGAQLVIYYCPVSKVEYTPPELQGRSLEKTQRLPEHDCFSLGVLIFQLLMDGSHPFRGRWLGGGDPPPIEEKIRQGYFPHVKSPPGPVEPPRNVPALDTLHPQVVALMRRCFADGHQNPRQRPTAEEWQRAIAEAEKTLVECRNGHYYSNHLHACPRCGARRKGAQVPLGSYRSTPPTSTLDTITCPKCGDVNDANLIYCQNEHCQHQLCDDTSCSHCGDFIPVRAQFCPTCGRQQ